MNDDKQNLVELWNSWRESMMGQMMTIKYLQKQYKLAATEQDKTLIAKQLQDYVKTLPASDQEAYRKEVITDIEHKFDTMDKVIAAYEALKEEYLKAV